MKRLFPLALVAAGCVGNVDMLPGPDGTTGSHDLVMQQSGDGAQPFADLSVSLLDMASDSYPAGPYGADVGNTLPPLQWIGYVDPNSDAIATTKPYAMYSMDDLRRSGRPYALLHISEFV
jgi:hypothetical protein